VTERENNKQISNINEIEKKIKPQNRRRRRRRRSRNSCDKI
jgi:hypothetical protein